MAYRVFAFADEACPMLDGQITAMQRNGLQGVEMRIVDKQNVSEISLEKAREVRKQLDDAGLVTWSIGSPIGKINIEQGGFAADCDKLRHTLEVTDILGAGNIRMFSFYITPGKDPAQFRSVVLDRLATYCEIAAGSGIDLCHENEKGIYGDMADRCLDVLQNVPQLKGVFDPANFVQCGQDTLEAWKMLKPLIKYMHIKDALDDGFVVPAGCGMGNVPFIANDFLTSGGNALTIEPHLTRFDALASLERKGEQSKMGKYVYETNDAAFDAACSALRGILA